MPILENARHEKFVQSLIAGMSQRQAYREAFPASNRWKDKTVDNRASELFREVLGRYKELQEKDNTVEIDYGVHIPCEITAVLEKESLRLYVMNVLGFENMLGLKYAKKEQAEKVLSNFLGGKLTIGKEKYKVSFQEYDKIHGEAMKKARNINRLSSYQDGQADFEIEKIKSAVNKLQENQRVEFKKDEIIVNSENFKTFTAILHNSIVLRLISGDYNII